MHSTTVIEIPNNEVVISCWSSPHSPPYLRINNADDSTRFSLIHRNTHINKRDGVTDVAMSSGGISNRGISNPVPQDSFDSLNST